MSPVPPAGVFYKIDSACVSFREYWWGTPSPLVVLGWLVKLLRIRIPGSTDDPPVETLTPFEVPEQALPAEVRTRFDLLISELSACGFNTPVFHAIHDPFHATRHYWATFAHPSGQAFARIHHRIWTQSNPPRVYLFPMFITAFEDGTFLTSSSGKPDMSAPAGWRINRRVGLSSGDLWASHEQALAEEHGRKTVIPVRGVNELRSAIEAHHAALRDFHRARGVFKPRDEVDQQQSAVITQTLRESEAGGLEHAEVLAELARTENKKKGWGGALLILAVSIAVFLGAGAAQWSWKFVLLLIPILLFHELGHYLAMRIFNYRNLRMFFIPLLGAAVSGQNYNVAGWKKAIVSLMGPVPGIALGATLGVTGLVLHHPLLTEAALLTLILNGFNLLPFLPLDGGWVMHAILFSRHPALDAGFRLLAGIALIILGLAGLGTFLAIIGGFMLMSLPVAYRLSRVTQLLRQRGLSAASADAQTIPPQTAQIIITELKRAFPKGGTAKTLAQQTLQVFESLNAHPPGWLASSALLIVHLGSAFMAVVFAFVIILGQHGGLGNILEAAATAPKYPLACDSLDRWDGTAARDSAAQARNLIVATFDESAAATEAFADLTPRLPAEASLRLFGQSLLLSLPATNDAARQQWVAKLQPRATDVFVASSNFTATLRISCIASNEITAQAIETEAQAYFTGDPEMRLIPPWSPVDSRPPDQRAKDQQARHTYAELSARSGNYFDDPEFTALQSKITRAQRLGDEAGLEQLRADKQQLMRKLERQFLRQFRREGGTNIDLEIVDLFATLPKFDEPVADTLPTNTSPTNALARYQDYQNKRNAALRELGARMGQLPPEAGPQAPPGAGFSARSGFVSRTGLILTFNWLSFEQPSEGAPAFADWLCGKHCIDLKYEFTGGPDGDDEDE